MNKGKAGGTGIWFTEVSEDGPPSISTGLPDGSVINGKNAFDEKSPSAREPGRAVLLSAARDNFVATAALAIVTVWQKPDVPPSHAPLNPSMEIVTKLAKQIVFILRREGRKMPSRPKGPLDKLSPPKA